MEWEKQLHKGDNLILAAFGGGFTWGLFILNGLITVKETISLIKHLILSFCVLVGATWQTAWVLNTIL